MPLLFALTFIGATAAAPPSYEAVWKDARRLSDAGDFPAASRIVDAALHRAGASNEESVWALRVIRGELQFLQGNLDAARATLERPLPPNLRSTESNARRLVLLGMLGWYTDRHAAAVALIEQALAISQRNVPRYYPEVLAIRAYLNWSEVDARKALRLANNGGDSATIAKVGANVAIHHVQAGRFVEGIALDAPVRSRLESLGMRRILKTHQGNIGWAYLELGDYDQAMERLARAEREAERMGQVTERLVWLNHIGTIHHARRNWAAAMQAYTTVLQAVPKDHRERGHVLANLARVALDAGNLGEARNAVRDALAFERANDDAPDIQIALILQARVDAAAGKTEAAEKTLRGVMVKTQSPITRIEAQARLAQLFATTGRTALANAAFQRAIDLVRAARDSINDAELRVPYFNTASDLFDDYIDFVIATKRPEEALRFTETSRARTLAEGIVTAPPNFDPRAIAKARNATILCYWLGRNRSWAWTITPGNIAVAALPPDHVIEPEVDRYGKTLLSPTGTLERSGARGQQLYEMLVAPAIRGLPKGSRVIIVADGKLHTLNFETLVVAGTPPRYWINDVVLTNASSLQLLAPTPHRKTTSPMLLVGDPPAVDPAFPPLANAAAEIASVAARFAGATVLKGAKATPAAYLAAKPERFDLVHFVAHGVAARTRPLDSAVILGLDAKKSYRLLARDIATQPLSARLVTISSCEGAGYATYTGEGLVGLAWAFRRAGAQQVVAALWRVDDMATLRLMERMYSGIAAKREPADALRDAKLALLRSGTAFKQPKYWAPFINYL